MKHPRFLSRFTGGLTAAAALGLLTSSAFAQGADECINAVPATVGNNLFDTFTATESTPPYLCESNTGPDVWFVFTAPTTDLYRFDICSASYDSIIEVADGTCGALNVIGCNDDGCSFQSWTTIPCVQGTNYYVRVGGWGNSIGDGTLTISATDVRSLSLAAHYKLDDTGGTAVDSSGNGEDGFYQNVLTGQPGARPGTGTSADFSGSASYVEVFALSSLLELQNDFSAAFWMNADAFPPDATVFTDVSRVFGNGPTGAWSFGINDLGGLTFTTHALLDYDIAAPVSLNTWHHVAFVMDINNDVTFYLDGNLIGTVAGIEQSRSPRNEYWMGAWSPSFSIPQFFDGSIDDLQIYSGALSAADVTTLFNNPGSVLGGGTGNQIGSPFCNATPNTTGVAGEITATGSAVAAANDVTLTAENLPPGQFGIFVVGQTISAGSIVPGSQGRLCLTGSIGRYNLPGQILQANANGQFALTLDLTLTPLPATVVSVTAGETWHYQAWHRDILPGSFTSNFTAGVTIQYQ